MERAVCELARMVALVQDRDRILGEVWTLEILLSKLTKMADEAGQEPNKEIVDLYLDQISSLKTELNAIEKMSLETYNVEPEELRFIATKLKSRLEVHEETYDQLLRTERVFEILEAAKNLDQYADEEGREKILNDLEVLRAQEAFSKATILTNLFPEKAEEVKDE